MGERFGIATDEFTQRLYERADELESERAEHEPPTTMMMGRGGALIRTSMTCAECSTGSKTRKRAVEPAQLRTSSSAACLPQRIETQLLRRSHNMRRHKLLILLALRSWLAALDDVRNWLIREAA